ncbi:MAG TPA: response regulator transcription factor [Steroidobacteraceae bacterium]|nr:response regulator transcription factor [Steroidobacteraceae bacterium]
MAARPVAVLLVEDDPAFREGFSRAIAAAPDMVLAGCVADYASGLAQLGQRPDVLLVDLQLPDGNGIDLIRAASARLPQCEIMVVSVFGDEKHVLDSIAAGATGYLLKDMTAAEIVDQIRVLRAGGSPVSPVIARQLLNRLSGGAGDAPAGDASATGASPAQELSEQEVRVLTYAAKGYSYDEIAQLMSVSRHTVQTYVKRSYRKLQVHGKVEALAEARRLNLIPH